MTPEVLVSMLMGQKQSLLPRVGAVWLRDLGNDMK